MLDSAVTRRRNGTCKLRLGMSARELPHLCGKCGSHRTRVTARSNDPPGVMVSCTLCQHQGFVAVSANAELSGIVCPRCSNGEAVERLFDRIDGIGPEVFYRCLDCG